MAATDQTPDPNKALALQEPSIHGPRDNGDAFDVNWIVEDLDRRGAEIVISQHPNRVAPREIDTEVYKWRHLIENFFCKLKEFKRIALRACKTDSSFSAMIYIGAAVINSR